MNTDQTAPFGAVCSGSKNIGRQQKIVTGGKKGQIDNLSMLIKNLIMMMMMEAQPMKA